MIAILEASRAGLLRRSHWAANVVAGVIVGIVALPLSMAFAIASGAKPEQGLYTAIIAGAAVSFFGGTRTQIAGPTGAFIVILAAVTAEHGMGGLMVATLMAGAILVVMGISRFGGAIRFIPEPVIVGFTTGIAVIIWVGQWKDFFGLEAAPGSHFHERLLHLLAALPHLHVPTTLLACASLAILVIAPRIPGLSRVPGPLLALVAMTALQGALQLPGIQTIDSVFGGIPRGLPTFELPRAEFAGMLTLVPAAFTIAMLGAIESLLSAVVADGMAGTSHDPNQELIGQGVANLLAPLFGGFAATGALARTATNVRNGATSPVAGVAHAVTLLVILMLLAPLAGSIPLCVLAAILFFVAWNMSQARHFLRIARVAPRADVAILLITFALTVLTDLVIAVNIGVVLATLQFLRRMAATVDVRAQSGSDLVTELAGMGLRSLPARTLVYSIDGPFFFGAVQSLERALRQAQSDPSRLVIRLARVPFMDFTGLQTLQEAVSTLARRGIRVVLCEANERVLRKLRRAQIVGERASQAAYRPDLRGALDQHADDGTDWRAVARPPRR
jgi:SulP family sulfate permease